jgi:hypothetical protein
MRRACCKHGKYEKMENPKEITHLGDQVIDEKITFQGVK